MSGNPKGRPPVGETLAEQVRAALAEQGPDGKVHLQAIIHQAIRDARSGDKDARNWLADRGYGKAPQPVIGDESGPPLRIVIEE